MSKEFKIILIIFTVVVVICGIIYFSVGNSDNNAKSNKTEETSSKSGIPKGISIKDENISLEDEVLYLSFTVKNTSKKEISLEEVNVIVKDNKDNTIANVTIPIDTTLESKQQTQLFSSDEVSYSGKDIKAIYSFKTK